ncbi:MAG: ABC transporter ATP-binding protein [Actinomycetota bacterium]
MPRDFDPKYKVSWQEELAANLKGTFLVLRSTPFFALASLGLTALQGLIPAVIVAQTGLFMSAIPQAIGHGLASASAVHARTSLIWIAGAILASQVLGPIQGVAQFGLERRFHAFLTRQMMVAVAELPGIAYFEDPKFRDKLKVSEWVGWAPVNSIAAFNQGFQQLTQLVGLSFVVGKFFAPWAPFVVIGAALPAGIAAVYFEAGIGLARWRHSPTVRKADYYRNLALRIESAKELRIFRLKEWLLGRQAGFWLEGVRETWKKRQRSLIIRLALQVPAIAAMSYAYIAMLNAVFKRTISIGSFAAGSMAVVGMTTAVMAAFQAATWMRQSNFYLPVAFQLMKLAKDDPRLDVSGTKDASSTVRQGIIFEGVTFVYPGTERKILDDLDLWIPHGSSIALVGENGAGKTTLIKLMCRFYDPTEGRILLDGIDIRQFDIESLRRRLAVIFQDFVHYHLPARDNVGFGAVDSINDESALREAARRVGVLEKIEELPSSWDTPLAREFDGVDLSGGEWQRVALARAMMAQIGRDADVLILDEPTASLDVRLEHDLYEHFAELSAGRTTLLVSHRFSTVRMAHRIVFLEAGRIKEDGDHDQLMALGGRYAELYEMQASHYRMTGVLE